MTSGIYELKFTSGRRYIGKSIDIEKRYGQHKDDLTNRRGSEKLLREYDSYSYPTMEVLIEAHPDHLDILETYLIHELKPELNTSIAKDRITDEDWELIQNHSGLMKLSTVEHIEMIVKAIDTIGQYYKQMTELETNVSELVRISNLKDISSNAMYHLETENTVLRSEVQELTHRLEYIYDDYEEELKKPWYKKLFRF